MGENRNRTIGVGCRDRYIEVSALRDKQGSYRRQNRRSVDVCDRYDDSLRIDSGSVRGIKSDRIIAGLIEIRSPPKDTGAVGTRKCGTARQSRATESWYGSIRVGCRNIDSDFFILAD